MEKAALIKAKNPYPKKKLSKKQREALEAWGFIGVGFLLFVVFMLYPLIKNFIIAFMNYSINPNKPSTFVGLANFKRAFVSGGILEESQKFYLALKNTFLAVLVTVPFQWFIGIIIAIAIDSLRRFKLFYRFMLYIPVISDWLVVAILFKYLFQPTSGSLVNAFLLKLNLISKPIGWFENAGTANIVIWSLCIWKGIGWVMMMYTAALQDLPKSLYEAAMVDGANKKQLFYKITLPLLSSRTYFIIISLIIGAFNILLQVMLITNGGPLGQTDVLLNYMYNKAFTSFDFGYAAAISLIMGSILITISVLQNKITKKTEIEF
ncbi:carbohydrate ABC transporter membrane protein 1, CUT1 family [Caloramator quimbayensis]|uniref:Carbohydrate ABC transporter membrane protein 1, CUT1 family n=1 Tax=Caloramator quimbayensis TaxID=1147123 RepID=A0A1T4XUJ4_9CLOT|nr:sugar ABC transporter permease [Caloramator quimbayensis]SKA93073.1 carbohydrate ABC transporter membrane protein 1, CUT1 family [Caloramator quimbayensis]